MKYRMLGHVVLLWSVVFAAIETAHFGYNWTPQSKEEVVCDATALLLLLCGIALIRSNPSKP